MSFARVPALDRSLLPARHRCPGEDRANALPAVAVSELAQLESLELPSQDLQCSMRRMPTRPASGVRISR